MSRSLYSEIPEDMLTRCSPFLYIEYFTISVPLSNVGGSHDIVISPILETAFRFSGGSGKVGAGALEAGLSRVLKEVLPRLPFGDRLRMSLRA